LFYRVSLGKNTRSYLKNTESKKDWEHGSSGRALPSKQEVLYSNTITSKKNKKN
jgi:hypothetical protein